MNPETVKELREFVEYALKLPNDLIRIEFDAPANDSPFMLTLMTNRLDGDGNHCQEPTISIRVSSELVEFWNNETMNSGMYPITMPHLGLFEALSAKVDDVNEFNAFVFLREMNDMRSNAPIS